MSNITNDKVLHYVESLYNPPGEFLHDLRIHAESRDIPIMTKDAEMLMTSLIRISRPSSILELGTAIGYSAICFAGIHQDIAITSLEISSKMVDEARINIQHAGLSDRINVIKGDAAEILDSLNQKFDLIFIDAAKGHYKQFFDHCLKLTKPGTIIISDNILYKGITACDSFLESRRNKTIMRRMRAYLNHITSLDIVHTAVLPVGDGMAISVIK
jgi:predicted O-methyltransferase YrrM